MKKLLLAAIVLAIFSTSAHAHSTTMPDVMLGNWCAKEGEATYDHNDNGVGVYQQEGSGKDQTNNCDNKEPLRVKPHEFMAWVDGNVCTPIIVQRIFLGNYLVRANCEVSLIKEESRRMIADFWFDLEDTEYEHSLRFVPMNVSKSWLVNFMVVNWYVLDGHCGHGIDQSEKEFKACDNARHSVTLVLNSRGYCYGKYNQGHAEMEWHKCTRGSMRGKFVSSASAEVLPDAMMGSWGMDGKGGDGLGGC